MPDTSYLPETQLTDDSDDLIALAHLRLFHEISPELFERWAKKAGVKDFSNFFRTDPERKRISQIHYS